MAFNESISSGAKPVAIVTGAGGFCGRHLTAELLASGYTVVGVDLAGEAAGGVVLRREDILRTDRLAAIFAETVPNRIFHLAALTNPRIDYAELHRVNALGTLSLLRATRQACPQATILLTSSSAVYGPVQPFQLPIHEDHPFHPVSAYAVSKVAQEMVAYQQFAEHGLRVIRARPFNLTGPGESTSFVTSALAQQVAAMAAGVHQPSLITGNLETTRDFTDVRDAVVAYRLLAERGEPGMAYNVCSGRGTNIRALLDMLVELGGIECPHLTLNPSRLHSVDVPIQVGDPSRLLQRTGWKLRFPLAQTLRHLLDSFAND